jgi:hypothetical protein
MSKHALLFVAFAGVGCGEVVSKTSTDAAIDAAPDASGVCQPANCDDTNACTTDACEASGCTHTPVTPTGSMTFNYTGTLQTFTVPACETQLRITALGAQGGDSNGQVGGLGASIAGDFIVSPGQGLTILVGGAGVAGSTTDVSQRGGTGGGGTFVVSGQNILVIAGGGGGAIGGFGFGTAPGGPGQTLTAGQTGSPTGFAGGTNGGGGTTNPNTAYHGGTGGGGYSGNGINDSAGSTTYGTPNKPGMAFVNGGAGGVGGSQGRNGGYGGGGSGGFCGAGGGGYSGGGAGQNIPSGQTSTYDGGGGGSINTGANQASQAGAHAGNGQVVITW